MKPELRTEEFLAKAGEAEELAAKAKDATLKSAWTIIARNYRELAAGRAEVDRNKERKLTAVRDASTAATEVSQEAL